MLIDIEELAQRYYDFLDFKSDKYTYMIYHIRFSNNIDPKNIKIVRTLREVGLYVLYDCSCADEYFQMAGSLDRGVVYFPIRCIKRKTLIARIYMTYIYCRRSRIKIFENDKEDKERIRFLNARFSGIVERIFQFE